jgi:amidase
MYGLRPTAGRIAGSGEGFATGLGVAGPMARSVRDLAMLLATQSAPTPLAPLSLGVPPDFTAMAPLPMKGLRIGWLGDFGGLPMEPEVLALCRAALGVLEAQGAVVEG